MIINFGKKHKDKSTELVLLKDPDYVKWIISIDDPYGNLLNVAIDFTRLINLFDEKKIKGKRCNKCNKRATRISLSKGGVRSLKTWCAKCDPYRDNSNSGKISFKPHYLVALKYVKKYCGGKKSAYPLIIRRIAHLKGLPSHANKWQKEHFF